ncbi:MAG TPA: hypothetical protein VFZ22_14710 [Pyrinomonadaceae bacterium]|nr:hypothetical protein [Pyrinomonadaceae bacterium]
MKVILSICCLILLSHVANADVPRPKPPAQPAKVILRTSLEVVPETNGFQARLQLSESDLKALRAALDASPGSPAVVGGISASPGRTIVAGLMLFFAISFAGVLLAGSKRGRTQKTVAAVVLVAAIVGAATIITRGNAGPPPGYWTWRNLSKNLAENRPTSGSLSIEVVPDDPNKPPHIRLIIPVENKKPGDE